MVRGCSRRCDWQAWFDGAAQPSARGDCITYALVMRSVRVFSARERSETVALLDQHLPEQRDPWVMAEALYVTIDDDQNGYLFSNWEPDQVAVLEAAVGHRPTWAVGMDLSGRIDGTAEV